MKKIVFFVFAILFLGCSRQPQIESIDKTYLNIDKNIPNSSNIKDTSMQINSNKSNIEEKDIAPLNIDLNENTASVVMPEDNTTSSNINYDFAKKVSDIVIYFDFDKYNIKSSEWPKIEKLANLINSNKGKYIIRIEGNCDEWGTEEYNYALGLKRANSAKEALIKLGVDKNKLIIVSYGELNPVCTAHANWCWKKNRRDNFSYIP